MVMTLEAAQWVRDGLSELIRLVNSDSASTADARRVLAESKAFAAQVAVLQADSAALVAARERHGDGGAGVLAQTVGVRRREAAGQVKAVQQLQSMPDVRDAVTEGRIPLANAKTLARASNRTSVGEVARDEGLLEKAASLAPENFAREAGRWVGKRQRDGGESEYRRQRARRRLSIWKDDDDGMVRLRAELDPVTGAKLHKRLLKEAERLRRCDVRNPGAQQRTLPQRLADALDALTAPGDTAAGSAGRASTDITIVQHLSPEGDKAFAEIPLCWGCHDKVHYHDWQVVPDGGLHTIEPPERIRHGPAHAPDPPLTRGPHRGGASDRHQPPMVTPGEQAEAPSTSYATDPLFAVA